MIHINFYVILLAFTMIPLNLSRQIKPLNLFLNFKSSIYS